MNTDDRDLHLEVELLEHKYRDRMVDHVFYHPVDHIQVHYGIKRMTTGPYEPKSERSLRLQAAAKAWNDRAVDAVP